MAVLPRYRGRRIAKLLLAASLEHIARHKAESADLYVSCRELAKTPHLHHLYESVGFTRGVHSAEKGGCYKTAEPVLPGVAERVLLAPQAARAGSSC